MISVIGLVLVLLMRGFPLGCLVSSHTPLKNRLVDGLAKTNCPCECILVCVVPRNGLEPPQIWPGWSEWMITDVNWVNHICWSTMAVFTALTILGYKVCAPGFRNLFPEQLKLGQFGWRESIYHSSPQRCSSPHWATQGHSQACAKVILALWLE